MLGHWLLKQTSTNANFLRAAPPTIVVEAVYPGANARMLADTVAAPIEQQVNGVENMLHLRSYCADDGTYSLAVTFAPGTDLNIAQVLVQNRVALAHPLLPELVRRRGVTVLKKSPAVRALLVLTSPSKRYDEIYLSNYASVHVRDELIRLPGVGDVAMLGHRDYGLQVWLDPAKLAAYALNAADVIKVLEVQNPAVAGGVATSEANALAVTVNSNGRLQKPEEFGNIVVKTTPGGGLILVRDIAQIELGANGETRSVRIDGHPAVALAIHALAPDVDAQELDRSLQTRLLLLHKDLPDGLALETALDYTPDAGPAALLVDVELPAEASSERVMSILEQCDAIIRKIDGVTRTLVTTGDPFAAPRARPCILIGISPGKRGREQIIAEVRQHLYDDVLGAKVRINDLASPGRVEPGGYPIAFAVTDVSDSGLDSLSKLAERIVRRLNESSQITDIGIRPSPAESPQLVIDIDREKAAAVGVATAD
ncbi:MAG TPA: efflux RND transporter permease subunit, partial [Chloroflexota bacterium]|nr:efflux RND transporter permease subunit [Chloroflexota bacterium]